MSRVSSLRFPLVGSRRVTTLLNRFQGIWIQNSQGFRSVPRRSFSEWKPKNIPEALYHQLADDALEEIVDRVDSGDIEIPNFDVVTAIGVVTINFGVHGTWVLNKQAPNRQIWLSSPISGPSRFDYDPSIKRWVHSRDCESFLQEILSSEFSKVCGFSVKFDKMF